ncbi:AAA family ATPase [Zavarzinella formosa]|uniref:AAA family ATPase n=1 Tax=Zavarzinella formosa TaxID=360055 RepID=UPI000497CD03|nr:AAA family ATPase [Zavarzinella formosa]
MSVLSQVTRSAPRLPSRVVLYAAEKFGKSSFGANSPRPVFLMTAGETGLLSLLEAGQAPPTDHFPEDFRNWSDLGRAVRALRDEPHDFRTLVLDTGNGAEALCQQHVRDEFFNGDWGNFNTYGRGNELAAKEWGLFLQLLDDTRLGRGMSILMLHHAKLKTIVDPTGKSWDQWRPESVEKLWSLTHKWSDAILFGGFKTSPAKDAANVVESRYLHTTASAGIVGGNRYGLPPEITAPAGAASLFKAFSQAMSKAKTREEPPSTEESSSLPVAVQKALLDAFHELDLAWHDPKAKARASEILGRPVGESDHVGTLTIGEANRLLAALRAKIAGRGKKRETANS